MDADEERRLEAAYEEYVTRSVYSQRGRHRKGRGPNRHLNQDQQLELAHMRANIHIWLLQHPAPPPDNPDMPF